MKKYLLIAAVSTSLLTPFAYAKTASCNTYSMNEFIPLSDGSLISGRLITPVNVKENASLFTIIPDGNVSYVKGGSSPLAGKTIKVPELKKCFIAGKVVTYPSSSSKKNLVNAQLVPFGIVCPTQSFITEKGNTARINYVVRYAVKPSSTLSFTFSKNLPTGSKVLVYSTPGYIESICDNPQNFILDNIGQGAAFKYGVLSGCSSRAVLPPANSIAEPATNSEEISGS